MSTLGMMTTVLATQIAEAADKDEFIDYGNDLSAGLFGPNFSALVRDVALQLVERAELLAALTQLLGTVLDGGDRDNIPAAELQAFQDLIAKAKGGAA